MKFLFKLIVIPLLTALIVPMGLLAAAYKDFQVPTEDFADFDSNNFQLTDMVKDELDSFLLSTDSNASISIGFTQAQANQLLLTTFRGMNPNYLNEDAPLEEQVYVIAGEQSGANYGYQGTFLRFKEDIIEIESGIHLKYMNFTYKTSLLLVFKLTLNTDEVVLRLEKLNLGNIPLAWTFNTASMLAEQVLNQDLGSFINEMVDGFATFDPKEREMRVDIQALISQQFSEDPQTEKVVSALLGFIKENELIDIGFKDGEFAGSLALGKLRDHSDIVTLMPYERITNEQQLQSIFASKATSLVFSTLSTTSDPFIELDAITLNRIFEYLLRNNLNQNGALMESIIADDYRLAALTPYITMGDAFVVNLPIRITDINDPTKMFATIIKLDALPDINGNDLIINVNSLQAGQVTLTAEFISDILSLIGDNEMISDGRFVIRNFSDQMSGAGMTLTQVQMVNSKLRLYIQLDESSLPMSEIVETVQSILDELATNPNVPPQVQESVNDLISNLNNPEALNESIEDLLSTVEGLSDEELADLYATILDLLSDSDTDLSQLFNLLN
jgi:hypothetical protein